MTSRHVDVLVLDLLEWIGPGPRPYAEVMECWRTSCPRLDVWETARSQGLLVCRHDVTTGLVVEATAEGLAHLQARRPVGLGA